jgi:tRNA nucleotidyltransferase (CCA-adding enzyme)
LKSQAEKIIQILEENNYEAYFIGGSVRNTLHSLAHGEKLPIKDYDIVTNASYQQVKELFDHVESRGASFHVAVVKMDGYEFEVAQYRGEVYPKGGSLRPDIVFSVDTLEEDVSRRDFTINGIAQTRDNEIIDHVNGVRDIRLKCIQTIGDPNERFAEDPLRIMRAFRFMAQLDYSIEGKTAVGMIKNYDKLSKIPHERMKEEFHKLLRADYTIAAFQKMRSMRFHKQNFFNSIEEKEVRLLRGSLDLQKQYFNKMLLKLDQYDRKNADISELYYILYYYKNYEFVKKNFRI